jgi:ABC-type sugar transport system permease subunit
MSITDRALPYLLLIPALVVGGIVLVYPLINGIFLSLTSYTFIQPQYTWIGLKNFVSMFKDPIYWEVFLNTIIMTFSAVTLQLSVGLSLALLLNSSIPFRGGFRGGVFFIWILPEIVAALIWMIMLNSEFGILNFMLQWLGIARQNVIWLGRPLEAKASLIMVYAWRGTPFFMVMILAALQTIPSTILDASKIDGATGIQRFFIIVIPYIRDIIILCCLLSVVRLFQDVTQVVVLTNGGPIYSTTTLAVHVYKQAFIGLQMGKAAAVGVTWLIFLFVLAIFYIRLVTKGEFRR